MCWFKDMKLFRSPLDLFDGCSINCKNHSVNKSRLDWRHFSFHQPKRWEDFQLFQSSCLEDHWFFEFHLQLVRYRSLRPDLQSQSILLISPTGALTFLFGYCWCIFTWLAIIACKESSVCVCVCVCVRACKPLNTRAAYTEWIQNRLITSWAQMFSTVHQLSGMRRHYETTAAATATEKNLFTDHPGALKLGRSVPHTKLEITLRGRKIMKEETRDTSNSICWDN